MSLFSKLLDGMELTEKDKYGLMKDRGFTEETIEHFQFKSPLSPGDAIDLAGKVGRKALQRERLLSNDTLIPAFTRNGLIPYFENIKDERKCVRIKGHKYGLPGSAPILFMALREEQKTLYLCESEYKAAAMWQLGYSAVGLCGISTFIGKHFNVLVKTLCDIRPDKCVVVFDNDDKADPESSKFSADPAGRYDAFKYQWYISNMLKEKGIESFVANLPNHWRIRGACDIDGALASGKNKDDFENAIGEQAWMTPDEFKESWIGTGEMDDILTPWADAKEKSTQVTIKDNSMWSYDRKGDPLKLTNFDMHITTIHTDTDDNIISRYVTVVNEFGREFGEVKISNGDLSASNRFSTWCLAHAGNLIYSGEPRNMHEIGTYLNTVSTPTVVKHTKVLGWNREHNSFLFGGGAYQNGIRIDADNGRMFLPSGAVEIDSPFGEGESPFEMKISTDEFDWRNAIEKMVANYGDPQVRIVITWCIASCLSHLFEDIIRPKLFPLLWVTGAMGSGKNTLLTQAMSFVGINGFEGIAVNQVTEASLWRLLAHFGSLPLWIDELRDDNACNAFDGIWRSVYNRTCTSKSKMNSDGGIITSKVRGTVALTGQDISNDTALNQRFIPVRIDKATRRGHKYDWINKNSPNFSAAIHEIFSNYDEIAEKLKNKFPEDRSLWKGMIGDDRMAGNLAVITSVADVMGIDLEKGFNFKEWACNISDEINETNDDAEFLTGLAAIINDEPSLGSRLFNYRSKDSVFIAYGTAYKYWQREQFKAGLRHMSKKAIQDELFSHAIAIGKTRSLVLNRDGASIQSRGLVLDKKLLPEELLSSLKHDLEFRTKIAEGKFVS